eukprot:3507019-Rhodomonas_salina.1
MSIASSSDGRWHHDWRSALWPMLAASMDLTEILSVLLLHMTLGGSSHVGTYATVGTSQAPVSLVPPRQNQLVVPGCSLPVYGLVWVGTD